MGAGVIRASREQLDDRGVDGKSEAQEQAAVNFQGPSTDRVDRQDAYCGPGESDDGVDGLE